ncbi:hypothetical protein MIR68_001436 [Amoeboaphelidium protococcarum]|nr:hypothetical protein MIR68_001436 [Amoeboaphelidium protococcarum]
MTQRSTQKSTQQTQHTQLEPTIPEERVESQELLEDEECFFQDIDELQNQGINASDIQKLKVAGVCTVRGVMMCAKKNLLKIKGLSEAKVDKIREAASKMTDCGFMTAMECAVRRQSVLRITTGSAEFDKLLGGGVQSMQITEVFGEFRTGKTQLSHTLCVACQLDTSQGGAGGKAAYIDTEGTFRPNRISQIATRFGLDPEEAAENVIYARAYNCEHQMELITLLAARFAEERGVYRLLVVDSIIALFRSDYTGRGELGERQQKLNQMLSRLIKISEEFNIAVFITNQMTSDPGAALSFVPDPKKAVGGHILAHASSTRIALRKGRAETRIAKINDSADMPEGEAVYAISEGGIIDASE